ncbi:MAG: dolichol kinase [Candidatus Midichloriaceae bacterium]|jgi:dolichol kinase
MKYRITFINELYRKGIHLLGILIPVLYYYTNKRTIMLMLIALFASSLIFDILRIRYKILRFSVFTKLAFDKIFRKHEETNLSGLTYACIGMLISLLLVSEVIFNLAILILVISDTSSAILGKIFGKHELIDHKTFEGSLAFLITSCLISYFVTIVYDQNYVFLCYAIITSVVATLIELFSKRLHIDDNLSIPLTVSILMKFLI